MLSAALHHSRYVRSNGYDPQWVVANQMGPNVLWLTESLCEVMRIEPGMKVLDLGCGRAMSSVFLARSSVPECGQRICGSTRPTISSGSSRRASATW